MDKNYDYEAAGFDGFLSRSIDTGVTNLDTSAPTGTSNRTLNFDQAQVGGALGDKMVIGKINLDGAEGRITVEDENGNLTVIIGKRG